MRAFALPLALLLLPAAACSGGGSTSSGEDMAGAAPDLAPAGPCPPSTVRCTDQSVQELSLFRPVNKAGVTNTADGAGWLSRVDATGGGFTPSRSYVYLRFAATGLERVDVGDEDAFARVDWDLAVRRFILRLNSGVSGPSCVEGARLPPGTTYESIGAAPDGLTYEPEAYFTEGCELVPDASGLGSPGTVLASFWRYTNCVEMTGDVFVIRRADGRRVKLTVRSYYEPVTAQDGCDATGNLPAGGVGGYVRLRWAFLDP